MGFETYNLGKFKRGQFDITAECKEKSESGKIVSIFDGDVTTYIYELPELGNDMEEIKSLIDNAFANGYSSYIATYTTDGDGNIFIDFKGSVDNSVDGITLICVENQDSDEDYYDVLTEDTLDVLTSNADFQSMDEAKAKHPVFEIIET